MSFTERHEQMAAGSAKRAEARAAKLLAGVSGRPYDAGPATPHSEQVQMYRALKEGGFLKKESDSAALKAGVSPGLLSRAWVRDVLNLEREIRRK